MKIIKLLLVILVFQFSCDHPVSFQNSSELIDVLQEPIQINIKNGETIPVEIKNGKLILTKKAKYDISAVVVSKEKYSKLFGDWTTGISNYDLALAWGQITLPANSKHISYSQSGRWYYYRYSGDSAYGGGYISSHSANTHIIHSTSNVLAAIKSLDEGDYVRLKGYLVYVDGSLNGGKIWWHSSLTRKDTGNGSCEVFYVEEVQIGEKIYQ